VSSRASQPAHNSYQRLARQHAHWLFFAGAPFVPSVLELFRLAIPPRIGWSIRVAVLFVLPGFASLEREIPLEIRIALDRLPLLPRKPEVWYCPWLIGWWWTAFMSGFRAICVPTLEFFPVCSPELAQPRRPTHQYFCRNTARRRQKAIPRTINVKISQGGRKRSPWARACSG
jgi:hypothetical protein